MEGADSLLDLDDLKAFVNSALDRPELLDRVRAYLRRSNALNSTKISNWKNPDRLTKPKKSDSDLGLPLTLLEGAALVLLGMPNLMARSEPHRSVLIPPIEADTAWHIFIIEEGNPAGDGEEGNPAGDGHVYRYWEGVRVLPDAPEPTQYLRHGNIAELKGLDSTTAHARPFGDAGLNPEFKDQFKSGDDHKTRTPSGFFFQCAITGDRPVSVGYRFSIPGAQVSKAREDICWEFLTSLTTFPVTNVYIVVSIPDSMHEDRPYSFNFADPISPMAFLLRLREEPNIWEAIRDPRNPLFGSFDETRHKIDLTDLYTNKPPLPRAVRVELGERFKHLKGDNRRSYLAVFNRPYPCTFQTIMYKLPVA